MEILKGTLLGILYVIPGIAACGALVFGLMLLFRDSSSLKARLLGALCVLLAFAVLRLYIDIGSF